MQHSTNLTAATIMNGKRGSFTKVNKTIAINRPLLAIQYFDLFYLILRIFTVVLNIGTKTPQLILAKL